MTYKDNGDNITIEMSTKLSYAAVGFNAKQEMVWGNPHEL